MVYCERGSTPSFFVLYPSHLRREADSVWRSEFVFIDNKDYATSNNIYSFYIAKEYLEQDDTVMLESDLIYDKSIIKKVVESKDKDIAVVAKYESWMDGTVVTCDEERNIVEFIEKTDMDLNLSEKYYKTVNIYKFSPEFEGTYIPFLEAYMKAYGLNSYIMKLS